MLDRMQIAAGFVPVNLATADNNSDWVDLKLYDQALETLRRALPLRDALGDRAGAARTHFEIARAERSRGDLAMSQHHLGKCQREPRRGTRPPSAPSSDAGPPADVMPSTRIAFSPRLSFSRPSLELTSSPESSRTRSSR